jgi:outer membrane protein
MLHNYTLRQCIEYAIEHNVGVRQSDNAVKQNAVSVSTAKWARLPNLNASMSHDWSWGRGIINLVDSVSKSEYQVYRNTYTYGGNVGVSTNVPLFTGFQIPNQYALAKLNFQAAVADLEKAKQDLAIQVASSYLQVLLTQDLQQVAAQQLALSQEQATRIARLEELGKASSAEVADANARVAQDEMAKTQADNNFQLALLDLSQLLELKDPRYLSVRQTDTLFILEPLTPPDEIYQYALVAKPELQAARYRLEGSEKNIRIAQSGYYPQLSFDASWSTGYSSDIRDNFAQQLKDRQNKRIGLSLSIPIFNRFATRNRVRTARLQRQNYALELDNVKKTLYKEIQQAWYNALAAESKYTSSTAAEEASAISFKLMTEKFENGQANAVEFNEAKQNLVKAQSDELQAKYEYLFRTKILDFYKGQAIE